MNLYVGTSGYSYKEWKGRFYPSDLPAAKMLEHYSRHFPTVEINSTFRALPKPSVLRAWAAEVPAQFRFGLKAQQQITHVRRLKDAGRPLTSLLKLAGQLGPRLGPLLFQLPPNFKKNLPRLQGFLDLLPSKQRAAFEFRHQSWFEGDTLRMLRDHGVALCVSDEVDDQKVPFQATAGWGYLRLRKCRYSDAQLKQILKKVRQQGWLDTFVFFKHEDEATGPKLAEKFLKLGKVISA